MLPKLEHNLIVRNHNLPRVKLRLLRYIQSFEISLHKIKLWTTHTVILKAKE